MTIWFGKYTALDIFGAPGKWSFHWNVEMSTGDESRPLRSWAFGPIWFTRYQKENNPHG
jgi:hypothetical protein